MDYELDMDGVFDVDAIIGDIDVDFEDDALTLPGDDQFDL